MATKNGLVCRQHISTVGDSVVATKRLFCRAPRPRHPQPNPKLHKRQNPAISKITRHCRLIFNSFQGLTPEISFHSKSGIISGKPPRTHRLRNKTANLNGDLRQTKTRSRFWRPCVPQRHRKRPSGEGDVWSSSPQSGHEAR